MLFVSMLAGIVAVNASGYKIKLAKGDGNACDSLGTVTTTESDPVKGITNAKPKESECTAFPSAWNGVVGTADAYKAYTISCTWDDSDAKNPVKYSSALYTDADCKTKSNDAMFADDYESGSCFVSTLDSKPVTFTMGDQLEKACKSMLTDAPTPEPTEEGKSAAAGVVAVAGFVMAAVTSFM